ncbi:MAG: Stk1 family PASTA domain-containing Ser/Thr kinase [Bifidobacterium thermacidophilum]|jgi:serine/threonine-protein kinase|nr:Stk1 family PASTA domain-containing Ser/Thr kinase [Bifidobacterium thermacidophilum]
MSSSVPTSLANGRYQLGQLVGRGGMAEVRVALDKRLGRTVAIKIMRSDLANDEIFLTRFRREAHSVAQMNNPNIVNIYDSGEETIVNDSGRTERVPYLVMEYVKGQTLRDIIKANGPLSQRDAEQVMLGVLNALEYSHRMGIIHRDIKPGNIMISDQGVVKVMDFGIARALDDSAATMTQSQGVVGTAQYLSPEQARGETVDMRSDLYSAGCVLYEMLTGRPPFTGDSAVAIAYQHVSEAATPPSAVIPGLPKMWDNICAKAMAKDRQNRYATATEFKNDILTFMNGGVPIAATFNQLTDLANPATRTGGETATQVLTPPQVATQTNPVMPTTTNPFVETEGETRAQQREAEQQRKKKRIIIAVVAAIVAIAAICGIVFALTHSKKTQMVTVPTFSSSTTEAGAEAKLEAVGLKIKVETDTNSTEPKGTFTKQSPAGGKKVAVGSTVKVWFSSGPSTGTVPDVSGKSQDDARSTLEAAGFKVAASTQTEDSDTVAKDNVTRTSPAAGSKQSKGTTILLYISSGMTKVPDGLVGQSKDTVLKTLQERGFNTSVEEENSDTVPSGAVTRLDPVPGTSIEQGSTINVYVSKGKEQVTVPSVVGATYASAKSTLEGLGFTVSNSTQGAKDTDLVTAQNPTAGTQADKGATITLTTKSASSSASSSDSPTDSQSATSQSPTTSAPK